MTAALEALLKAANRADKAYSAELVRAYGQHAAEKRYARSHLDASVQAAMTAKLEADAAWFKAWHDERRERTGEP